MNNLCKDRVSNVLVDESSNDQRIDNFLQKLLKGVPKNHIYRILRSGEVRVNGGRIAPKHKLKQGDKVRIPPIRVKPVKAENSRKPKQFETLFEDDDFLIIEKPAGVAVHGGSGVSSGVIEHLRAGQQKSSFLELVHRLDKETSGILMLAKKRQALVALHEQIRAGQTKKIYLALVDGKPDQKLTQIEHSLRKFLSKNGERRVLVDNTNGKPSITVVKSIDYVGDYTLVEADLRTGRTHQIRVHLAHEYLPILGDDKYGDFTLNRRLQSHGLKRMFLHAHRFSFTHPKSNKKITIDSKLPRELNDVLMSLRKVNTKSR